jgi:hypothetical protein
VCHHAHSATPKDLQWVTTLIRSMTDIRRSFPVQARRASCWRGTAAQIRLVEWLVRKLDQPADSPLPPTRVEHQSGVSDGSGDVVRLFYFPQARTQRDLYEVMQLIRIVADIRRSVPYEARKVIGFSPTFAVRILRAS